jgi:hypothetical protein
VHEKNEYGPCPSVCPHVSSRLPRRFLMKFITNVLFFLLKTLPNSKFFILNNLVNTEVAGARSREMAIRAYLSKSGNHNNQYQPQYRRVQTLLRDCVNAQFTCRTTDSITRIHYRLRMIWKVFSRTMNTGFSNIKHRYTKWFKYYDQNLGGCWRVIWRRKYKWTAFCFITPEELRFVPFQENIFKYTLE